MIAEVINDKAVWDAFVDASPCSTLFHKWDFLRIVEKHSGYKLYPYGIFDGNKLRCVYPLYFRREFGVGAAYSAPPAANLPYLGFITDLTGDEMRQAGNEQFIYDMTGMLDECASRLSSNYTYMQTVPDVVDIRPFRQNGYHTEIGFDYYFDLTRPIDEIRDGLGATCRRDIRQQEKAGLEIRQSDDVDIFYDTMRDRFTSLGLTTYYHHDHRDYIQETVNAFPDNVKLLYVCRQGNVEGVALNYAYNGRYLLWMGYAGGKFNEYFLWETIKIAKDTGNIKLEIPGGDMKRLTPFKSKFNPSLELVYAFYKADSISKLVENSYSLVKLARGAKEAILT
jgi:hypothetical protein